MLSLTWLLGLLLGIAGENQRWSVQTSGVDTNLRGMDGTYGQPLPQGGDHSPVLWVCGSNGVILRSNDGGKSWKRLHVEGGEGLDFRGIRAFGAATAFVMSIGDSGKSRIYKTTDGGETWRLQYTDQRKEFFLDALVCLSETRCFAISDPLEDRFLLLQTEDGEHWKELSREGMPRALPTEGVFAASGTSLAICRGNDIFFGTGGPAARVFHSPDLGRTWSVAATPIVSGNASTGIFSLACSGDRLAIVGGDYLNTTQPFRVAAYSLDRGASWQLSPSGPGGFRSAVAFLDKETLVAVGPKGEDVSFDGGVHWKQSGSLDLNAVFVLDGRNIWAAGPKGTVVRYDVP
jgi:photosystem II stability/assembly factor-like uncharacterized protein